ncbi:MAG: peptide ABC transporter substrate-binding protein [Nitriliruptorales bacterium]
MAPDDPADAAGGSDADPPPVTLPDPDTRGGVLYAYLEEPASIDPAGASSPDEFALVDHVFDSLTRVGASGEVLPAAAESWEPSADLTSFKFRLRADGTFHDGSAVEAQDFVRAWRRLVEGADGAVSPSAYLLDVVEGRQRSRGGGILSGVVAEDDRTLRVDLAMPFAEFPVVAAHPALGPVPPSVNFPSWRERPVGNGPFAMAEPWQHGRFIRLEAVAEGKDEPTLEQIVYRIYEGEDAEAAGYDDFTRGNLDVAPVPEDILPLLERDGSDAYAGPGVIDGPRAVIAVYAFNTELPPFDDPRVRQAISLLIDARSFPDLPPEGTRVAARSVVPPGFGGYEPPFCDFCRRDPTRAEALLAELEEPLEPIELAFYDHPDHRPVAEQAQQSVNEVLGPDALQLRPLSRSVWMAALREGELGFFLSGWVGEYPSPDAFLYPLLHPSFIGQGNPSRYASEDVTLLLDEARATADDLARERLYRQAEARALADAVIVPLFFYRHAVVVAERVQGYRIGPTGLVDLTQVSLVEP